jgi:hypothetical protein
VIAPVTAPAAEGSKLTVSVAVWPALRVNGKLTPDIILNPAPVGVPALMMSGAVPEEVRVTDLVAAVFTATLPKARLGVLRLRVGMKAFSSSAAVSETVPEVAVRVAGCVVVTEAIVAKKATLVALAGTVTVAGSVTAGLLLERLTFSPPLPAAALRNTVQESVPDPVIEWLLQESAFSVPGAAAPVPVRLITADGLVEELLVRVSAPVTAPATEGSKLTVSVAVCPWLRVSGKLAPGMLKPAPATVPALMVSGAVPVDIRVTDCGVAAVFTVTLPNAMLPVLSLKCGMKAFSSRAKVFETVPEVAVRVTVCAVVTEAMVAEKATLVALAGTVTVAGRVTAGLLLERLTLRPPLPAAELRVTVQASVPDPVIETLVQESVLGVPGAAVPVPVPLRLITAVGLEELLVRVSAPATVPVVEGWKLTVSVAVCPRLSVIGKLAPDTLKPAPVSVPALMVSGAAPEEVRVTDSGVAAVFTVTLPKARLLVLRLKLGMKAFSSRAKVLKTVPEVAVRVTLCAVVTEEIVAEKSALVALAGTVTVAGRVTAGLLLERLTLSPPLPAAALRVTVQASVPERVIEPLEQENALSVTGTTVPVPLRLITADGFVAELLARVSAPVTAPVAEGSKLTVSVAVCPWLRVSGKLTPDMLKPAPVTVPALMVTGAVPVDIRVTDCGVAAVFTMTLPKARLPVLRCRAGVGVGVGVGL